MQKIKGQQATADKTLKMVYPISPFAIVAGGAPRDWIMGKEASDIDVFVNINPKLTVEQTLSVLESVGFNSVILTEHKDDDFLNYLKNPNIINVYSYMLDGIKVQIINLNTSSFKIVDTFAFNICKVWYKNNKIVTTPDFNWAVTEKTIIKQGELYACSEKYKQKIKDKFPDFKYYESEVAYMREKYNAVKVQCVGFIK